MYIHSKSYIKKKTTEKKEIYKNWNKLNLFSCDANTMTTNGGGGGDDLDGSTQVQRFPV